MRKFVATHGRWQEYFLLIIFVFFGCA